MQLKIDNFYINVFFVFIKKQTIYRLIWSQLYRLVHISKIIKQQHNKSGFDQKPRTIRSTGRDATAIKCLLIYDSVYMMFHPQLLHFKLGVEHYVIILLLLLLFYIEQPTAMAALLYGIKCQSKSFFLVGEFHHRPFGERRCVVFFPRNSASIVYYLVLSCMKRPTLSFTLRV